MAPRLAPLPLSSIQISRHYIPAHGRTPNTSVQNKPLLIYHGAFPRDTRTSAASLEEYVSFVGAVVPQWRYTMYSTSHFHSTSHEVLWVASGRARCCFGCEDNPGRVEPVLERGDVVIVPAGVAHRLLEDLDGGFQMVGSYPSGCTWDMCYSKSEEAMQIESIGKLPWLERDPVYGDKGPALE